jgi:hypothetical protein
MASFSIELDEQILDRAREVAESRQATLESLVEQYVTQLTVGGRNQSTSLGLFHDEPEAVDQMLDVAYEVRRKRWTNNRAHE